MKFSVFLPTGFAREFARIPDPVQAYNTLSDLAVAAELAGYETLWAPDHLTTIPPSHDMVFEVWSVISALARDTSRIRLGQMVTSNGYRHPALLAKIASTVDVLSSGRLAFGIGAGWYEPDYVQYGYEFGTVSERLRRLDEAVQIIRSMWTQPETTFQGMYYRVSGAVNEPKGVQKPHVPLMIAGGGEKVTLRLVARYADACNIMDAPDVLKRKFATLERHCDQLGREYSSIKRTATTMVIIRDSDEAARALVPPGIEFAYPGDVGSYALVGSVETIQQRIAAYAEAGVQELALGFEDPTSVKQIHEFADLFLPPPPRGSFSPNGKAAESNSSGDRSQRAETR
jgi:F420-dependent oxidoreductase-like protein